MFSLLAFLFCAKCVQGQQATYKPYHTIYNEPTDASLKKLKNEFDQLSNSALHEWDLSFDSAWHFSVGDVSETLNEFSVVPNGSCVNLPHRAEKPNTALWYTREIEFKSTGIIAIQADDGAQLFCNGKRINRLKGIYFPIETIAKCDVTIRVLNNAMSGGLRNVTFYTSSQFARHQNNLDQNLRLKKILEKILLFSHPSKRMLELVQQAVHEKDSSALLVAEKEFEQFPLITGPWIQREGKSKWILSLITDKTIPVVLTYGDNPKNLENKITQQGEFISFPLKLNTDKKYFYKIIVGKTISPVYSFETSEPSSAFNFTVWADSQSGWNTFQTNIVNTLGQNDAFGIGVGDLVSDGSDAEEWRMFFNTLGISSSTRPYYLIAGNHDHDGYYDNLDPFLYKKLIHYEPHTYFSWTHGNCAFIALNPNETFPIGISPGSEQYNWFHSQLNSPEWKKATWRFVLLHQPPYSQGWAGYEGEMSIRSLLEPVLESSKIDFIISGHTHDYERITKSYGKQKTTYIIVGGAGGSLEPPESSSQPQMDIVIKRHHIGRFHVKDNSIFFESIGADKIVIDSFRSTK